MPTDEQYLSVYLNDHLAGSTMGIALARRLVRSARDRAEAAELTRIAGEIDSDRTALKEMMTALGIPQRTYKIVAGAVAERLRLLKPHGGLLRGSPLSLLMEREMLCLGVQGKLAGWRALHRHAQTDERLDADRLDGLIQRAERQAATLEALRLAASAAAFS